MHSDFPPILTARLGRGALEEEPQCCGLAWRVGRWVGGRALAECETGLWLRRMDIGRMVATDLDPAPEGPVRWWLLTPGSPTYTPACERGLN